MGKATQVQVSRRHHAFARSALALALTTVATGAWATDGYFAHGYGMKAKGRGGASLAVADDAFGGANNPASMAFAPDQADLGIDLFSPRRSASRSGLGPGLDGSAKSGHNWFGMPEFGYKRQINDRLALGVTVYGNGGMNTDYPAGGFDCGQGPANMLCGGGSLGVNLSQLVVAPTLAWSFAPGQAIGFSPLLAYQRFSAKGLHAFAAIPDLSVAPSKLTNNGVDTSTGGGLRVGYLGQFGERFSLGVSYSTKLHMGRFSDYEGLFAEGGKFNLPENFGVGIAFRPTGDVVVAADYLRINYGDIPSIANPSMTMGQLGSAGGPGFGWKDVNVWKLGVEWASSENWTWRAGYNRSDNPIRASDVTFNILAPGVVTDHLTLGFTWRLASGGELTMAYMHAFENSVSGASILPAFMGGMPAGSETIRMYEDSIGIQYEWKL